MEFVRDKMIPYYAICNNVNELIQRWFIQSYNAVCVLCNNRRTDAFVRNDNVYVRPYHAGCGCIRNKPHQG